MFALRGRMELEIASRADFSDSACGLIIPAGTRHAFVAPPDLRMVVIDAPDQPGLDRIKRFAVTAPFRHTALACQTAHLLKNILSAPRTGVRRGLKLDRLDGVLAHALHEPWTNARMAAVCQLSPQRFHARMLELTGLAPQTYLRALRLDEAERLLCRGLLLDFVAPRVGYRSGSALAYALRRDRGVGARRLRAGGTQG